MKFRALILELHLPQNFCHRHTDRHFPKIVKSCSGHPKTCKSIENRKSKICTKPIFCSTYIEESKNRESIITTKCNDLNCFINCIKFMKKKLGIKI